MPGVDHFDRGQQAPGLAPADGTGRQASGRPDFVEKVRMTIQQFE